jgi:hypothetical protein
VIARVWRGVVAHDRHLAYVAYVDATGVAEYRRASGCLLSAILTRDLWPDDAPDEASPSVKDPGSVASAEVARVEVIAFSIWDCGADIEAFAGPDIDTMVLYPEDEDYLLMPPTLAHHHVTSLALPSTEGDPS